MGAAAAMRAAHEARQAGLVVTGTVDFLEDDQMISALAERHPSGTVTLLEPAAGPRGSGGESGPTKIPTRQNPTIEDG